MRLAHPTGLGRHIDVGLSSNRAALAGSVTAGVVHGLFELLAGNGIVIVGSLSAGLLVFLSWAIAREIDPDDERTATRAMILTAPLAVFGSASAGVVAVTMIALRMIAGTTGVSLMAGDVLVVLAAAGAVTLAPGGWIVVPLVALGAWFAVERWRFLAAAGVIAVGGAVTVVGPAGLAVDGSAVAAFVVLTVFVMIEASAPRRVVRSTVDSGTTPMDPRRIRLARRAAGVAAVAVTSTVAGASGLVVLAPLVASRIRARADQGASGGAGDPDAVGTLAGRF